MTFLYSPRGVLSLTALMMITACAAVGPNPSDLPETRVQAAFDEGASGTVGVVGANAFWSGYQDRTLSRLIAGGLETSLDIIQANERIRAAAADLQGTQPLAAQITGDSASASRVRSGGEDQATGYTSNSSLSAGFVFDLFGGARRAREGASAAYASAEAEVQVTRLAWLAEVINAYSDARFNQQALALTRETIRAREGTLEVTRNMLSLGLATDYDIAQTEALLQTAQADLPSYEAQFNAQVYRLSTLLNLQAGPLMAQMQAGSGALRIPPGPGTGVPADLLRNRPDVRAAQQDLAQALAEVGVATADMLPSLSLSGTVSDSGGTQGWSFGPRLSLPVAGQGVLAATRTRRLSEARSADLAWRASVAAAVEDVQTSQSNLRRLRQRVTALDEAATSYDRAYDLARTNFEAGALPLVDLLDADRQRASARLQAASARNDAAAEWAALQIATGAGAAVARIAD
ncbi:efflux transporter outer membrane subunit (plasmid) [Paracoccus liaowanqingii]|uniref:Efflux transporter outer membrane subunit n=2 Tax=Paracoccus liaowanqingii TaxID=2560053 RepID=A0A4Y5SS93_9RHOB|nr:efflux transporter outer membrane subunit [Paracoccus liaowanqingii]